MVAGGRPTVFISSTIRDFADLRSAVRFWLEEAGFEVWMSEFNDMEKPPGANAFDACFASIRQADFYVLLLGEARGSTYSEIDGTSVTQQEYREAYAAFKATGKPIPFLLVRSRTRDLIEGWAKGGHGGDPPFKDAPFMEAFIAEVERQPETAAAIQGVGPQPLANWLHRFSSFRDVIDALRVALALRVDVPMQRTLAAIKLDVEVSYAALLGKHHASIKGTPFEDHLRQVADQLAEPQRTTMHAALDKLVAEKVPMPFPGHWRPDRMIREVSFAVKDKAGVTLTQEHAKRLAMYVVGGAIPPDRFHLEAVEQAVRSGQLLRYDPPLRSLQETPLSMAVEELLGAAHQYRSAYDMLENQRERLIALLLEGRDEPSLQLPFEIAVAVWAVHHAQVNLFRRLGCIYAYLIGTKDSPAPEPETLWPTSPFGAEMDAEIEKKTQPGTMYAIGLGFPTSGNCRSTATTP